MAASVVAKQQEIDMKGKCCQCEATDTKKLSATIISIAWEMFFGTGAALTWW
jgi:hypothetical protein